MYILVMQVCKYEYNAAHTVRLGLTFFHWGEVGGRVEEVFMYIRLGRVGGGLAIPSWLHGEGRV